MYFVKKIFILIIISSLIFSCKTKKNLERKRSFAIQVVFDSISKHYINYETLLVKSSVNFEDKKKKFNLKATIKIKHDSLVIISLSPGLGIEVARIKFTNDSVFILDRLSWQLTKGNYKFLKDTYKVNIQFLDIQSILTNELFIYPRESDKSIKNELLDSYVIRSNNKTLDLYRKTDKLVENLISINTNGYHISSYIINDINNKRNLKIKFEDEFSNEFNNLPKRVHVQSSVNNSYTKIKLNYTKVTKNKSLNFSFNVPKKYKKIIY